jgi:methionyl-tRNA synthetase
VTAALEIIWRRVRRCNRYVEERAPWKLAKDDGAAAELDVVLASLAEAVRVLSVLLAPYLPSSSETLLSVLGTPGLSLETARFAQHGSGARVQELAPLFPRR